MFVFYFIQGVTHCVQEVIIRPLDNTVHIEFNDRLRFPDGVNLPFKVGIFQFLFSDQRGVFNDFENLSVHIDNRVVRCLNPDLVAAFGNPFIFP